MDELVPPRTDAKDTVRDLVRASMSLLTFGTAGDIFDILVKPPVQKRRDAWTEDVTRRLVELERQQRLNLETLLANESFQTTLITATREAIATHQEETIEALRNAVLNSALPEAPDDSRQKIFIQLLSRLTPWHVKILRLFDLPNVQEIALNLGEADWRLYGGSLNPLMDEIDKIYPEFGGDFSLCLKILQDLHENGLLVNEEGKRGLAARITDYPVPSRLARDFLEFIESPLPPE